jgi:hypothetical protein
MSASLSDIRIFKHQPAHLTTNRVASSCLTRCVVFPRGKKGEAMTYRVCYGHPEVVTRRDAYLDDRIRSERFSTEYEALSRARELIEQEAGIAVAVHDGAGNQLCGLRLQLKLGFLCQ